MKTFNPAFAPRSTARRLLSASTAALSCAILLAGGCTRTQTLLVSPGQPIRLLVPVDVPAKGTATEVAKDRWVVNDAAVTLPAGAYVVVLPSK